MALLATCLLSFLLPQEPATPAAPTPAPVPSIVSSLTPGGDVAQGNDDERAKMQTAERAGAKADPAVLAQLASSPNEKVAARAAFLLGRVEGEKAIASLGEVVTASPHTTARVQAMNALLKRADVTSVQAAIRALEDKDLAVRTLAAQLLGKLRRPAAVDPLLALLERKRNEQPAPATRRNDAPKATDLQAALVALQDLGAKEHLLRAATALQEQPANGVGDALSYLFQNLSPKLDRKTEVTVLVAVLGHHEPLLRRYAIGRLGALAEPTTASALEGRLANETELRPLVEVALSQVRHEPAAAPANEGIQKFLESAKSIAAQAKTRWNSLSEQGRWIVAGSPISLLVVYFLVGRLRRSRRERDSADATMALVAPSEEHLQEMAAEAEALEAAANAEALAAHNAAADEAAPADDEFVRS